MPGRFDRKRVVVREFRDVSPVEVAEINLLLVFPDFGCEYDSCPADAGNAELPVQNGVHCRMGGFCRIRSPRRDGVQRDARAVGDGEGGRVLLRLAAHDVVARIAAHDVEPAAAAEVRNDLCRGCRVPRDILNPDCRISLFAFARDCDLGRQRQKRQRR